MHSSECVILECPHMNSVMSVFLCDDMCIYLLLHLDCCRSGVQQENWSSLLFGCFFCLSFGSQPQEEPFRDGSVMQREKVMRRGKGQILGVGRCCLFEMRFSSTAQLFYMSCREAAAPSSLQSWQFLLIYKEMLSSFLTKELYTHTQTHTQK